MFSLTKKVIVFSSDFERNGNILVGSMKYQGPRPCPSCGY